VALVFLCDCPPVNQILFEMKKRHRAVRAGVVAGISALLLIIVACGGKEKKMGKGFVLPEGDVMEGKLAFIEMECHRCHSVAGEVLPKHGEPSKVQLHLGGEVYKVKTYGQLVTSIINPQHVISKDYLETLEKEKREGATSPMPSVNDKMTVTQVIDIVAFLNSCYIKYEPGYDELYYGP
jgi:sulfur-oxidizing protein SoxX